MTICHPTTNWALTEATTEFLTALGPEKQALAEAFGWSTLLALSGRSLAICPVEVRPCRQSCAEGTWRTAPAGGSYFAPYIAGDGRWVNSCSCAGDPCACGTIHEIKLPGPIGDIDAVIIDGLTLPTTAYRVDDGVRLVRQDGEAWPGCQNLTAASGEGTFIVRYFRGVAPDQMSHYSAALLAYEYAKAMSGNKKCRLPKNVTAIVRQGVSMEISRDMFVEGKTGIDEVDAYLAVINPNRLKLPPRVVSPDSRLARTTTWSHA